MLQFTSVQGGGFSETPSKFYVASICWSITKKQSRSFKDHVQLNSINLYSNSNTFSLMHYTITKLTTEFVLANTNKFITQTHHNMFSIYRSYATIRLSAGGGGCSETLSNCYVASICWSITKNSHGMLKLKFSQYPAIHTHYS